MTEMDAPQMKGTVETLEFGEVKIHQYQAPDDSILVHSTIIEGPTKLVMFDSQLFLNYAEELADYVESLGKPLDRIIISHGHPDHWGGLYAISPRFPDAEIYALSSVIEFIKENGDLILKNRSEAGFGPYLPPRATVSDHVLEVGSEVIDSVTYEFQEIEDGESESQTVVRLPDQDVLMVFDLVCSSKEHAFITLPTFDSWISALEGLDKASFTMLLAGHGRSVERSDIESTIAYLRESKEIYVAHKDPKSFSDAMANSFPTREHPDWIEFAALLLYGVIDP